MHFDEELEELRAQVREMADVVVDRFTAAAEALIARAEEPARRVLEGDADVNARQMAIDERCLRLLALQQPLAGDLRLLIACIKVNGDLERIGDQAVNIAGHALRLSDQPPLRTALDITTMTRVVEWMVREAIEAFVSMDVVRAERVLARDDEVDQMKEQHFHSLLASMLKDPSSIERALGLILVSRSLERIADHATNIAEDAIFLVDGRDVRHGEHPRR
ncbi:MAG: phosphate signaling complex protein PhoU [Vicinamibacterales bacterium]|nr:phosphate signaling complex protein PhoU [Vicinamibacterales bacterium]